MATVKIKFRASSVPGKEGTLYYHLTQEVLHLSLHSHLLQLGKFQSHIAVECRHHLIRHRYQQVFHRLGFDAQACSQQASQHYIFYLLHHYNSLDHFFPQGVKSQIKNAVAGTKHIAKVKANVFIYETNKLISDSLRISCPILYEAKVP